MRTPQYSRGSVRRPSGRMTVLSEPRSIGGRLPVGERCQPRIDVRGTVVASTIVEAPTADRAESAAVRATQRMHGLGKCQLVGHERREVDFMMGVDARHLGVHVSDRQGRSRPGINARQELIAQHDVDRLVELVEAPDARSAGPRSAHDRWRRCRDSFAAGARCRGRVVGAPHQR